MRIAVIVGAVALAGCNASDQPQPITPEVMAKLAECGKFGAAWVKQNPLEQNRGDEVFAVRSFYSPKTTRCWLIKTRTWGNGEYRDMQLIDAQTGISIMACFDYTHSPSFSKPEKDCAYIKNVENGNLASGFMVAPFPSQADAK